MQTVRIQNQEMDQKEFSVVTDDMQATFILGSALDRDQDNAVSYLIITGPTDEQQELARKQASELKNKVPHPTVQLPKAIWAALRKQKKHEIDYFLDNDMIREVR